MKVDMMGIFQKIKLLVSKLFTIFPQTLIIVSIIGVILTFFVLGRPEKALKSLIFILPIGFSGVYLFFKFRVKVNANTSNTLNLKPSPNKNLGKNNYFKYYILIFIFLYLLSIISLYYSETRPFLYFVIVSLLSGIIFIQIAYRHTSSNHLIILLEVILLSLNISWGVTLKYGLYYGWTDTLVHLNFINIMLSTGHSYGFDLSYQNFPIFHILISTSSELTGMSPKVSLFIIMGIVWQIGLLFSYMIFKKLCQSESTALIASLLFAFSSQIIFYGYYPITRALAFVFVIMLIYLIISWNPQVTVFRTFLILFVTWMIILTHHATTLFIIPLMLFIYILKRTTHENTKVNFLNSTYIILLSVEFLSYLIFGSYDFATSQGMAKISEILSGNESTATTLTSKATPIFTLSSFYYPFVILLSLIGIGYILHQKDKKILEQNILYIGLAGLMFLIFYVPGPLDLIPQTSLALVWRLPLLVSPLIAFCMALGVQYIIGGDRSSSKAYYRKLSKHKYQIISLAMITSLVVLTTFFSTLSGSNAQDSLELMASPQDSGFFSKAELSSLSYVSEYYDKNVPLFSDYPIIRKNINSLNAFTTASIITGGNISYISSGYLILRIGQLESRNCLLFSESKTEASTYVYGIDVNDPGSNIIIQLIPYEKVYDGQAVNSYLFNQ